MSSFDIHLSVNQDGRRERMQLEPRRARDNRQEQHDFERDRFTSRDRAALERNRSRDGRLDSRDRQAGRRSSYRRSSRSPDRRGTNYRRTDDYSGPDHRPNRSEYGRESSDNGYVPSRRTDYRSRSPTRPNHLSRRRSSSRDRLVSSYCPDYSSTSPPRSGRSHAKRVPARRGGYQRSRSRDRPQTTRICQLEAENEVLREQIRLLMQLQSQNQRSPSRDRLQSQRRSRSPARSEADSRSPAAYSLDRTRKVTPSRADAEMTPGSMSTRNQPTLKSQGNGHAEKPTSSGHMQPPTQPASMRQNNSRVQKPMPPGRMQPPKQPASMRQNNSHAQKSMPPGGMQSSKQPAAKRQSGRSVLPSPKSSASISSAIVAATNRANASSQAYPSPKTSTVGPTANVGASGPAIPSSQDITTASDVVLGDDDESDWDSPSGSEYEDPFFGKPPPKQTAKNLTKENPISKRIPANPAQAAEPLSDLQLQAAAQSISGRERERLEDVMWEGNENMSEVTKRVRQLYTNNSHPNRGIEICPGRRLEQSDILSLLHIEGLEKCAWFTDAVILALLALEGPLQADVHTELDFGIFLDEAYVENSLDQEIEKAKLGEPLEFGFPFQDVTDNHARIMGVINPSGSHWFTFEFVLETEHSLPTLFYYNSLRHARQLGPSYKAVKNTLPKLLYLASFQTNSPLAGLEADDVVVQEVDCPQQVGSHECGPMSIFCYTRRLYSLPVSVTLPDKIAEREFGEWTRGECVGRLVNQMEGTPDCLGQRFSDPLPTFPDDDSLRKDNDRRLRAALDYLGTIDSGDSVGETIDCHVEANLILELEEARDHYNIQLYDMQLYHSVRELLADLALKNDRIMRTLSLEGDGDGDGVGGTPETEANLSSDSKPRIDVRPSEVNTKPFSWTHPTTGESMEGTIGHLGSSSYSAPVYRIEIGARGPNATSIIAIVRYSGRSHWWITQVAQAKIDNKKGDLEALFRQDMKIAAEWAAMYMRSIADNGPVHLIAYCGHNLQTTVLPAVGYDMYDIAEYRGPACPVCNYETWKLTGQQPGSKLTKEFKTHVAKVHIRGNAAPIEKDATTGKHLAICNWPGCRVRVERPMESRVRAHILRHQSSLHTDQWLREQLDMIGHTRGGLSSSPQLPTVSTTRDARAASVVSRSLQSIIGEYIFTRRCFYCPNAPKIASQNKLRLHQYETHAGPIDAEFRCDHELLTPAELGENWGELPGALKHRLTLALAESENRCPSSKSFPACRPQFDTPAEFLLHCDRVHAKEPALWSIITENQCGLAFASDEELHNHKMVYHEDVITSKRLTWSGQVPTREIEWTRAITMDLDELIKSDTTPVLLSIGADGFTCSPLLMSEWLKQRDRNFIFAVTHDNESTLDPGYLTPVQGSYVTTYDLGILSGHPSDIEDPRHVDLVGYWDRLQSTKDGCSRNVRGRNIVPRDNSRRKRGSA